MRDYRLSLRSAGISDERYGELRYFCLQYDQYKAQRSAKGKRRMKIIDDALAVLNPVIAECVRKNVTQGVRFEYMPVPCGRRQFYEARRAFFVALNKMVV